MNLVNTCRTCLQNNTDEPVEITENIYEFLETLNMQQIPRVHPQLQLPQSVCFDCYRNLIAFRRFWAQCRDAENYFKMKLQKIEHELIESTETLIKNDDYTIEDDSKIYCLTREADDDLLQLIENCEEDSEEDEEIQDTYVDENTNIPYTDLEMKASEIQNNTDGNTELATNELDPSRCYNEDIEILHDNPDSYVIIQYDECSDIENKKDGNLLVSDEEQGNQIETENYDETTSSNKTRKRFQCQYCDKSFSSRYDLQMHENIHTGIKPFTCNICGKSFRQKNILRTHETLHFGKTIKCEECGKTFARKSQLILHNRMHRNEKPFVCDYDASCGAAFRERQHLLAHQKIHSGLREHQCDFCPRAFYHRKGLLGHMRDVHGSICYQCDLCERSFNKPYKIRKHMQVIHNLQLTDVSQFKKNICSEEYCEDVDELK